MASNQLSLTDYIKTLPNKVRYSALDDAHGSILDGQMIYEYPSMRLLAIMPKKPTPRIIKMSELDNFVMQEITDGTVVTLYKQDGLWKVASYNNTDISQHKRFSTITFLEAIRETLSSYPKFNWDKLNETSCYTLCFSHPGFHPLQQRLSCYFLASYNLDKVVWYQGLQVDDIINQGLTNTSFCGLPAQPIITDRKKQCIASCKTALDDYLRHKRPVYGYLLKNKTETILIESKLMKTIRQLVYNIPKHKVLVTHGNTTKHQLAINDIELYVTLQAYLSTNNGLFITLFPQYKKRYEEHASFIHKLADDILLSNNPSQQALIEQHSLVSMFSDQIKACGIKLIPSNRSIIIDYLQNIVNLMVFYNHLAKVE